ncbi:hypothetical protein NQ317_015543 [Molorchus minor]|uniref:Kinesin-like protein KIF16B n=1 Tax=Molorchus minor TaxID=1323400 RepID=A0ABQ9JQ76_9CUCU|nr:hypothetical protein NQ317_015543 [Molorchus minor]
MASVKVAVRVRPFNQREIDMDSQLIIQMRDKTTGILNNKANARDESLKPKEFTFDYSYWSHDKDDENYASQERVYNDLGTEVVDCAFGGYNACVFAYGQTGSGKTFTMMGSPDNPGLIPRICKALFDRMTENSKKGTTHKVQVSYLEIYQERVADLLRDRGGRSLKVREHQKNGPYVQGLTTCLVTNYGHIHECMERGNSRRTTAATNMNDVSSRSHAIFTITFVQAGYCDGVPSETVSKIHLVDLAGSERADATGAKGQRLKEGAHINKSLVTLGLVISLLAEVSSKRKLPKNEKDQEKVTFIPYRDSVLTWLLKDSLGGNSKTIMIAAVSPADCNYTETLSTLRYANRAKNIINRPTVNEDQNVTIIRELRAEISKLKALMFCEHRSDMLAQLHEIEAREKELTEEWAGKWREAQAILREQRALGLRKAGPGVVLDSDSPNLVSINDDPYTTGIYLYHLKEGTTTIGTEDAEVKQDIELRGAGMEPQHCTITFINGVATLIPQPGAYVLLNNAPLEIPAKLSQGNIIVLGRAHVFRGTVTNVLFWDRYNDPVEAAELRKGERTHNLSRLSLLSWSTPDLATSTENLQSTLEDEKIGIEQQRKNLEKEKEQFEKDQEAFGKKQEAFEKRRRTLEQAQSKLQSEKMSVEEEFAGQTQESQEDWHNLTGRQGPEELRLSEKGKQMILKHGELERERQGILADRKELSELQAELNRRVQSLCERQKSVELLDKKIVELVDKQNSLFDIDENSETQGLTLNLKRINSLQSPDSCEVNCSSSIGSIEKNTHSSDSYHTAAGSCGSPDPSITKLNNHLMSDSGVELRPSSIPHDESDLSSNEERVIISDSQSTSSIENHSPIIRKSKRKDTEMLIRKLAQRISQQKQQIVKNLDSQCPKSHLDNQIAVLQELQRQYMSLKYGCTSALSPASEHPLQDVDSPSPIRPLHTGSTSALYSSSLQLQSQRLSSYNQSLYRSMPSITIDTDCDSTISITSYCIRGAGSKTHYEYEVRICTVDDRWTILRRYSRFRDLHIAMKARYRDKYCGTMSFSKYYLSLKGDVKSRYDAKIQLIDNVDPYSLGANELNRSLSFLPTVSIMDMVNYLFLTHSFYTGQQLLKAYKSLQAYKYYEVGFVKEVLAKKVHENAFVVVGKVSSIPFPSKTLFANTESVAQNRKRQLELYLQRLIETCRNHPACPLAYGGPITKSALISFSPFFRKGVFENGKYGTS